MVAKKFIDVDEAAKMLGVSVDTLTEMRERGKVHGYRDGASWKFKPEEIQRAIDDREAAEQEGEFAEVDEDPDSILLSEVELGQSDESTSSTIIGGKSSRANPAESDIQLAMPKDGSDVELDSALGIEPQSGSDVLSESPKKGSGVSPMFDELDSLDLDLPSAADSGISSKIYTEAPKTGSQAGSNLGGSEISLGSDALQLGGSGLSFSTEDDLALGEATGDELSLEPEAGGSAIELVGEPDDDLVLGGSSHGDLSKTGDSGISLFNAADSGLSLESAPLDLGGSKVDSLDLGDDDMILTEAEAEEAEAAPAGAAEDEQNSDDDFLLTPLEEAGVEESDSGSQVIALDEDVEFEDVDDGGLEPVGGGLLEDDLGEGLGGPLGGAGALAPVPSQTTAPVGAGAAAAYLPEAPFSGWNVASLAMCAVLLLFVGMFMFDLLRNMWSWNAPYSINSTLMDAVLSWFEGP